jgi:phage terminase large subunit-like protein
VVVRWLTPDKNKVARAETACALVDAGRIWLPRGAPWIADFLEEVVTFPNAAHDDQVDVLSYAAIELGRRTVHPRKLKFEPTTMADKCWAQLEKRERKNRHHPVLGRI